MTRISAGVDVSKNRSTVCIMDQDGKVIMRPFLVWHSTEELDFLADTLKRLNGEVRVIMESTSIYQYPIALHLLEAAKRIRRTPAPLPVTELVIGISWWNGRFPKTPILTWIC